MCNLLSEFVAFRMALLQNPKLTLNHNVLCFAGALGNLQTLKVDENHLVELPDSIGRYY